MPGSLFASVVAVRLRPAYHGCYAFGETVLRRYYAAFGPRVPEFFIFKKSVLKSSV